jgi:beta-galactosidase
MKDFGFRKTADYDNNTIIWNQPYRKDRIVYAIAYKDGVEVCRDTLQAHTEAVKVVLEPDVTRIKADGQDLSHIKLTLYDENGIEAQTDNRRVTVKVTGEGLFRCLDTGDLRREGSFAGNSIKTYFGKALIVVQSTRKVGEMQVEVEVEGFDKPFILPIYTEQL